MVPGPGQNQIRVRGVAPLTWPPVQKSASRRPIGSRSDFSARLIAPAYAVNS